MKVLIDTESTLSPDLQVLYHLYKSAPEKVEIFESRFSPYKNQPILPYKERLQKAGLLLLDGTIVDNSKLNLGTSVEELADKATEFIREKFKGKKTGSNGPEKTVKRKLIMFFNEYPEFMDLEIIKDACQRYLNSVARDNFKFLQRSDYFIFKNNGDGGGSVSNLAIFCEEVKEKPYVSSSLPLF